MKPVTNTILLFKTNIQSQPEQNNLRSFLDQQACIERWTIDTEDVDCVLRIVATDIKPATIISAVTELGYECTELE